MERERMKILMMMMKVLKMMEMVKCMRMNIFWMFVMEILIVIREARTILPNTWEGLWTYGADYDKWERIEGLSDCQLKIKDFVVNGFRAKRFPLPNPLQDPKTKQLKVFMDMVDFLRPRFVLMENVIDLLEIFKWFSWEICFMPACSDELSSTAGHDGCWSMRTPTISHVCLHVGCPSRREIATMPVANT